MSLTARDLQRLKGVDDRLVQVAMLAVQRIPAEMPGVTFFITEGLRTPARQAELVRAGASKTLKSNHITGRAFDFALMVGGDIRWDWNLYRTAAGVIKACAEDLGVRIEAGADWVKFRDGPHIELAKEAA